MNSLKKLITLFLVSVMTINAFGIAQVSHICKMAADQVTLSTCDDGDCGTHDCCPVAAGENCCTDVVKYYRQQVNTTVHPVIKLQPDPAIVTLLISFISESESLEVPCLPVLLHDTGINTGKSILFETHNLLI